MKITTSYLAAAFLALIAGILVSTGVAGAAGCPSEQTVVEYDKGDPPYQCAQRAKSGKKSLAALQTKTWTNNTHVAYYYGTDCYYRSSSDVSVSAMWASSSYTATATNWNPGGSRHYAAGVIWRTGPYNSGSWNTNSKCDSSKGAIKNRILRITDKVGLDAAPPATVNPGTQVTITGYVSPSEAPGAVGLTVDGKQAIYPEGTPNAGSPVGGKIEKGKFKIVWLVPNEPGARKLQVMYGGDTSKCGSTESSCGFSKAAGKKYDVTINGPVTTSAAAAPVGADPLLLSGAAPVAAVSSAKATDPGLRVKTRSGKAGSGLSLKCPAGSFPLNGEIFGADTTRALTFRNGGIAVRKGSVPGSRKVQIQLSCRERNQPKLDSKRISFGTAKSDRLRTGGKGSLLLAGPGADRVVVAHRDGVANGGVGRDRIVVKARDGIALGGPGRDVIRSATSARTLLVGGPGRDRIIAGGRALVNAKDGERDVVTCKGSKVRVRADRQDRLVGACKRI